jgi:hypothetical protein
MMTHFQCPDCKVDVSKLCKYDQNGNLIPSFTEDQKKVLLDLQANYSFVICPFTEKSVVNQSQSSTVGTTYQDPLKQLRSGILAKDVKCQKGLTLVIKAEDSTPACVTSATAAKLLARGWTKNSG